jgi:hypothetical protein
MTRDFTLEKYSKLISALKDNYTIMGVADYISSPKNEEFIAVLRHDVDKFPGNQIVSLMAITGLFRSGIIWMQTDYPWRILFFA